MGAFIFFLFIVIVISLICKSSKSDENLQKQDTSKTKPANNNYYFDDYDEDLFEDEDSFDDEIFIERFEDANNSRNNFFDRIMDSSTPESAFIKGLEDEGYDVENW